MFDFQKFCRWYMAYCGVVRMFLFLLLGSIVLIRAVLSAEGQYVGLPSIARVSRRRAEWIYLYCKLRRARNGANRDGGT